MTDRRMRVSPGAVTRRVRAITHHPANEHHRLRSLARVARCELQARITDKPVTVAIGDRSRILAHLHAGGSWRAVLANPPDWNEMQAWRNHLHPGDLFVDIGAHAGVYTLWALDLGCTVVAVEPIAELVAQLRANLALNGYGAEVRQVAVAAEPGTMTMTGPDLLRRHLEFSPEGGASSVAAGEVVDVVTLDSIIGDRVAAGVKVDVEGAERLVVQGASSALADRRIALMQLEWNDCARTLLGESRAPVAELLRDHGYELLRPDRIGRLVAEDDIADGPAVPDLFARPAGVRR